MQKKIIALAVAGLMSGAAFAQSNVTIYGVADVAVQKTKDVSGLAAAAAGMYNNGDSRLGFMGSEDLGGGLKANFKFEQGINIATGGETGTTQAGINDEWNRGAWVGLSGGFGEVRVGREYTAAFYTQNKWELTGYANYSATTGSGTAAGLGFMGGAPRNSAQVLYISPSFSGLNVLVGYVFKNNMALNEGTGEAQTDIAVSYANGPIAGGLVYANNGKVAGKSTKDVALGASYDFGMGKLGAGYYDKEGDHKGYSLGVGNIKAGPVLLTVDYAKQTGLSTKGRTFLLEAKYNMSKRTFLYTAYRNDKNNTTTNTNFITAGVRHNF